MGRQTDGNLARNGLELVFPGRRKQGFSSLVRIVEAPPPVGSAATPSAEVAHRCLTSAGKPGHITHILWQLCAGRRITVQC